MFNIVKIGKTAIISLMIDFDGLPQFNDHTEIVTSQRSPEFVFSMLGIEPETLAGCRVLDLGSGHNQSLARELEVYGAEVVSLDPNLPYSREYLLMNALNDLRTMGVLEHDYHMYLPDVREGKLPIEVTTVFREAGLKPTVDNLILAYKDRHGYEDEAHTSAVAGVAQALPFGDGLFKLVIATTSVPYGLQLADIPVALAEISRVLEPNGRGLLWPVVCGDVTQPISLEMIRELVKQHRQSLPKAERAPFQSFGLSITSTPASRESGQLLSSIGMGEARVHRDILVVTRKV